MFWDIDGVKVVIDDLLILVMNSMTNALERVSQRILKLNKTKINAN